MVSALPRQALSRAFLMQKFDPRNAAADISILAFGKTFATAPSWSARPAQT
jgi:hypothetical protein